MEKDVCKLSVNKNNAYMYYYLCRDNFVQTVLVVSFGISRSGLVMMSLESSELLTWISRSYYDYDQYHDFSATLTKSEKGLPPEFEFVGVPSMIRKEKGKQLCMYM
jgi:hypothetical protein